MVEACYHWHIQLIILGQLERESWTWSTRLLLAERGCPARLQLCLLHIRLWCSCSPQRQQSVPHYSVHVVDGSDLLTARCVCGPATTSVHGCLASCNTCCTFQASFEHRKNIGHKCRRICTGTGSNTVPVPLEVLPPKAFCGFYVVIYRVCLQRVKGLLSGTVEKVILLKLPTMTRLVSWKENR